MSNAPISSIQTVDIIRNYSRQDRYDLMIMVIRMVKGEHKTTSNLPFAEIKDFNFDRLFIILLILNVDRARVRIIYDENS